MRRQKDDPAFQQEMTAIGNYVGRTFAALFRRTQTTHFWMRENLNQAAKTKFILAHHKVNNVMARSWLESAGASLASSKRPAQGCTALRPHDVRNNSGFSNASSYLGDGQMSSAATTFLRVKALGATVAAVVSGAKTLKDARTML